MGDEAIGLCRRQLRRLSLWIDGWSRTEPHRPFLRSALNRHGLVMHRFSITAQPLVVYHEHDEATEDIPQIRGANQHRRALIRQLMIGSRRRGLSDEALDRQTHGIQFRGSPGARALPAHVTATVVHRDAP